MAALTLSCLNIKIIVMVNIFYMAGVSSRFLFLLAFFFASVFIFRGIAFP